MKILVISQYFYPENFRINDLVFSLKKRGHQIEVLTGKPNYPKGDYFKGYSWKGPKQEEIEGIKVHRANLILRKKGGGLRLFLNYFSFVFFGLFKIFKLRRDFEKIFIYAPSPITVGILGIIAAKKFKCKSYLWVHDLWPESVKSAGGINNNKILGMINHMTKFIYNSTNRILVQSPEFVKYIKNQNVKEEKLIYYPYYAEDFYRKVEIKKYYKEQFPKGFNLIFAGNIGVAQGFETTLKAFEILKKEKINLIVLGEGRDKKRIMELVKKMGLSKKIFFLGAHAPEEIPYYFSCADALLVTLKKADIFSYTIPGKLQSYLASGKPIIGALEGIGRKIINNSKAGYCVDSENHQGLSKIIYDIYKLSENERVIMGNLGIDYFQKNFEKEKLLNRLELILEN